MGPRCSAKALVERLKTFAPRMSAGLYGESFRQAGDAFDEGVAADEHHE
jgi:hypothetical protein